MLTFPTTATQGAQIGLATGNPYVAAGGAALGAIGDIFGGGAPEVTQGLLEEDRDAAIRRYLNAFKNTEELNMAPYSVGGYTLRGGGILNKKQVKQKYLPEAAKAFLLSQGLEEGEAGQRVEGIQNRNRPSFKKTLGKEFLNFLRAQGGKYNLNVRKGKIKGRDKEVLGGSFSADEMPADFSGMMEARPSRANEAAMRIAQLFSGGGMNG